ncbi:MAG: hypothetical protein RLO17_24290 [Cyclobacteriaceae bacterium]|jgi:hypothetical protein
MPANVVTTEDLYFFKDELLEEIRRLLETHGSPQRKWLRSQDVQDLLCISAGILYSSEN